VRRGIVVASMVVAFGLGLASGLVVHRLNESHRTVPVVIAVKDIPAELQPEAEGTA
jgi:hypothetical protein